MSGSWMKRKLKGARREPERDSGCYLFFFISSFFVAVA